MKLLDDKSFDLKDVLKMGAFRNTFLLCVLLSFLIVAHSYNNGHMLRRKCYQFFFYLVVEVSIISCELSFVVLKYCSYRFLRH